MTESRESSTSIRRKTAFTLIAIAIPVILLVGVELVLRTLDAAPRAPLFIENPQLPEYSLANPRVVERLFARPEAAPAVSIETGFFRTRKADGGLRLVVQGGSSAAGFPYGYSASLAGMLEQRLRMEFPEREVEVVTTAMSAVNTYALLDFADEIIAIEPDAILIYAGHNEFLGILGVGSALSSSQSPWLTRLILGLRRFALYRSLERALAPDAEAPRPGARDEGTLMARIAAEKRIPIDSRLFERGVEQFRVNLETLLGRYREAGVPVFIGTLASNERDQAPFASAGDDRPDREDALQEARLRLDDGQPAEALGIVDALIDAEPADADAWYVRGSALTENGQHEPAAEAFQRARDLDQLRFRAPSVFNDVIRQMADRNDAVVVDVENALRRVGEGSVIGRESMLEHLHPNLDGYFLLADAFHGALVDSGIPGPKSRAVDDERARAAMPVSEVDRWFGRYKVTHLMNHWPFTDVPRETVLPVPRTTEQKLARELYEREIDWTQAHRRLLAAYAKRGDERGYLRTVLVLADAFPFSAPDQYLAGVALGRAGRQLQAVRYLLRADRYKPNDKRTLVELGRASMAAGLKEIAVRSLEHARDLNPTDVEVLALLEQARQ
jgi:tetratricopeptide (TPR) repeat protein